MFKDAGLEPRVVASPAGALMELLPAERRERVAVLSVGQAESHLAFVGGDTLRSARTLRFGMTKLEQSIAKNLGVASEDAEAPGAASGWVRVMARSPREMLFASNTRCKWSGLVSPLYDS